MKKWYQSWTVWFNIALLAVATINHFNEIVPLSPAFMLYVGSIGNFLLRFKTVVGIKA